MEGAAGGTRSLEQFTGTNIGQGGRLMLYSHNIHGMRDAKKRERVLTYFQHKPNSIVFLQETYTVEGDLGKWTNIWKAKVIRGHGTVNSRGVAILFHQDIKVAIDNMKIDENGRYILLQFS